MKFKLRASLAAFAVGAAALWLQGSAVAANSASDDGGLEEVIVTSERREADLQDVALAVSVISGEDIAELGSADIGQVLQHVPSLVMQNVTGGNSTQSVQGSGAPPNITIRGLGTDGPNRAGAVAVYQDGVLMQGGGGNSYDMSRVEVLRGPQGTLYGRGATGGAVNFITANPVGEFQALGRIQAGSNNLLGTQGMLNVPFSDAWAVRAAFNQVRRDGYFNNGLSDENTQSARLKLRYSPSDSFALTFSGVNYRSNSNAPGVVDVTANPVAGDWVSTLTGGSPNRNRYRKAAVEINWDTGLGEFTYLGGYQTSSSYFTSFCNCFFTMAGQGMYVVVESPLNKTTTHEARLASTGDSRVSWQGGVYYYSNQLRQHFRLSTAAPPVGSVDTPATDNLQNYDPSSLGLFGEASFALSDSTRVTAGVRHTRDDINQDQCSNGCVTAGVRTPVGVIAEQKNTDWRLRFERDLSDDHLIYATASTGYRPGAVVQGVLSPAETVNAYEFGSKSELGERLILNGAAYYYDYGGSNGGFQNVLTQPVTVGGVTTLVTDVVPIPAKFYGVEIEATLQFSVNDRFTFSPAFQSAEYTDSCLTCVVGMGPTAGQPQPLLTKGKDIPRTPHLSFSATYEHRFSLASGAELSWQLDARHQSSALTDFDLSNYPSVNPPYLQKAYTVANTALTIKPQDGQYTLTLYGRNLGNEIYKTALGNANPAGAPPGFAFYVNEPRTFGLILSAQL